MASQNNLNAVFTDIANAIRSKKGSVDTIKPINMADEINSIEVGSGLQDFLAIRNANSLFNGFSKLTYEQLSSCLSYDDTSKVTSMSYMFNGCSSLTTIPLLNTSNVTNMQYMFQNCSILVSVPLIDTSKVTTMYDMFALCSKLEEIPFFDTSNVTNMNGTFRSCYKLTTIPQLNTSKVTNMNGMFSQSRGITTIPQLDTSNVIDMNGMFQNCYLLEKIDITKFANGTNYNNYFVYNCYSLKTLIIRTLDTIPTLNSNAFTNCYHFYGTTNSTYNPNGLKDGRIYVPDDKVEELKVATNWSVFADIIKPLSEYVE